MWNWLKILFTCCLLGSAGIALAQALETITLRYRPAEQVIPELRPMLAPGGVMTGKGEYLFVQTTAANLEQLRQMLAVLDRPVRRLLISVRHGGQAERVQEGTAVAGEIGNGRVRILSSGGNLGGGRIEIRQGGNLVQGQAVETRRSSSESVAQQVQTVEGGRAYIHVGQSLPLALRQTVMTPRGPVVSDSIAYREIGSGFYAVPRLNGERVTLDIYAGQEVPGNVYGSAEVRRIATTIAGRLGEWLPLGGVEQQATTESRGLLNQGTTVSGDSRQVWLKVEALD
jgi:type II secretory pathway component GspD/PulD (secretin)